MPDRNILGVIGCGQMGGVLLAGMVREGGVFDSTLVFDIEPSRTREAASDWGVIVKESSLAVANEADVVVLAVKPAQVKEVLSQIAPVINENKLLISIAAGISLSFIAGAVDKSLPLVRVMPNTPCLVGEGAVAVSVGNFVTEKDRDLLLQMFSTVGMVQFVPEGYMDAVTAVSGSGPGYLFLVAEAMTDAAVEVGLPRQLARLLVNQTLLGTAQLLIETGEHPAVLRDQVTSPGGTTIAGLTALEGGGLRAAFFNAVKEAFERSKLLGQ